MKIALRCDASIEIGTGHVMRCLTLARALRDAGAECRFVTRALPGHMGARIADEGFDVTLLPAPQTATPDGPSIHARWAGVDWVQDAEETRCALDQALDWLVLDHYAFDARWQMVAQPEGAKLMVVDDLADRPHACDMLLDQNLGRARSDYDGLVPDHCVRLIGPHYALLRPEFARLRAATLAARQGRGLQRLLISMGGMDAPDATSQVLKALHEAHLPESLRITVLMGGNAPALTRVRTLAQDMPFPTEVAVDVGDMAARMATADLAIGAAGATTWERCVLGLPGIIVQIADNQSGIARALVAAGAALDPGPLQASDFAHNLHAALAEASAPVRLDAMSQKAVTICDGDGVGRVLALLCRVPPDFRIASSEDSRRIWEWRAASEPEHFRQHGEMPDFLSHHGWFSAALSDPRRDFRILLLGGWPCGYLRLDQTGSGRARVSICLAPAARGQGLAAALLAEAARVGTTLDLEGLDAEVHPGNTASLHCFERAGYQRGKGTGSFRSYHKCLSEGK